MDDVGKGPAGAARRLRDGLSIFAIAVVLLLAAEASTRLVLRLSTGSWPATAQEAFFREIRKTLELYRRHPFLNTAPAEGVAVEAFGKRAAFNSLGYRSPERPVEKPSDTLRVLCAGGSTTFDILAQENEATWPWLLEERLVEQGLPVEVWNAGFPGWTSLENGISLILRDLDLSPDLVVLFQGINDLQPGSHRPFDRQYLFHAVLQRRALGFDLESPGLADHSVLVEKLRNALGNPSDPWSRLDAAGVERRRWSELAPGSTETFARNVRALAGIAHSHGVPLVLVTQVVRVREGREAADHALLSQWLPELEPSAAPAALEHLNRELRLLAESSPTIGIADAARDIVWRDSHFADAMHFSAAGSERFATYLASRVAEALEEGRLEAGTLDDS